MAREAALKSAFEDIQFTLDDKEVLATCDTYCTLFNLKPEALATKWETYAVNNKLTKITVESLNKWKPTLNKLYQQFQNKKSEKDNYDKASIGALTDDIDAAAFGVSEPTQANKSKRKTFKVAAIRPDDDDESTKIDAASLFKKARSENGNGAHSSGSDTNGHANGQSNGHANGHDDGDKKTKFLPVLDDVWSSSQDDADASFAQRQNPGKVELTLAPTIKIDEDANYEIWDDVERSVQITVEPSSATEPYRFMGEDLDRKAAVLDDRIVTIGAKIEKQHMLLRPEMFHIPAQDSLTALGRICADSDAVFSETTVVLEADEERTKARVTLDFKYMTEKPFSAFPGQIAIVEGVNTLGRTFQVTEFHEPKYLPLYKCPANYKFPRAPYAPLNILIASGPFTTSENLAYRPLDHLLEVVERTNPQVVVLVGPFVDTSQNQVKTSDETFTELFKSKVSAALTKATGHISSMSMPPSKIIMVPHPRDPDAYPLPQPPFDAKEYQLDSKWIKVVSNPCTMRINDVTIGVTSVDIIKHLSAQEVSRNVQGDRFSRLCGHVLKQGSYYPLFPPAPEVSVEVTKMPALELPYAPDVLIMPSDLQHFAKNVSDTVCINPGRLAKGKTGGTFAKVTVYPNPRPADEAEEGEGEKKQQERGPVAHRTKVEIVRI